VIGILRVGDIYSSFPEGHEEYLVEDFSDDVSYFPTLLRLIGTLKQISREDHFIEIKEKLSKEMEALKQKTWNIESSSKLFFGRERELEILEEHCHPSKRGENRKVFVVSGEGGMGKSQMARHFANRASGRFQIGWWLNAETEETLQNSLSELAFSLSLVPVKSKSQEEVVDHLVSLLETKPELAGWLLLFDNLEEGMATKVFQKYVPRKGGLALITSRNNLKRQLVEEEVPQDACNHIRLGPLNLEQALTLLVKISQKPMEESARKVVEHLGCLPLAISQAGSFMLENSCSPEEFLHLLEEQEASLLSEEEGLKAVSSTFLISIDQIRKIRSQSLPLLQALSLLAPDNVPISLLLPTEANLSRKENLGAPRRVLHDHFGHLRNHDRHP